MTDRVRAAFAALMIGGFALARPAHGAAPSRATPVSPPTGVSSQDIGWPREITKNGATLIYYEPQVDEWKDYKELMCRVAFSLTAKGGQPVLGVASIIANTIVDQDSRTAFLRDIAVTSVRFPSADATTAGQMEQLFRTMIPSGGEPISIDRIMAMIEGNKVSAQAVRVNNDPPPIFHGASPAMLLLTDGDPVFAPVEGTDLEFVVNTNWDLFREKSTKEYFLLGTNGWFTSKDLNGPWDATQKLPKDVAKLPAGQNFDAVKKMVPAPKPSSAVVQVFYSKVPAELVVLKGAPVYSKIPGTGLLYVANTNSDLFVDDATKQFYVLLSGRWFRSVEIAGPWTYAGADLPADFAKIPATSPKAHVLASVPGTQEAADAVMLAQISTSAVIDKAEAEAQVKVEYDGPPQFKPIEQTSMQYATNTDEKVIKLLDVYYLCFQGVWFMSTTPTGPWKTADSVPPTIYTMPPSSPVYNVTYVTQTNPTSSTVECSHTAGYFGMFVTGMAVGSVLAYGTGYYHPPYVYGGVYYRSWPPTYGVGAVYHTGAGAYSVGRAAYGPYGSAGGAARYNPATGRYGRAATVQDRNGGRTVASSYNPWTGSYGRTSQGHNAYAQWGSSVATRGNQWAKTGHVTTAGGTAAAYRTSRGESGVVARGDNGTLARTDNSVYAGRDGNVYKRNDRGEWSQAGSDGWNRVDRSAAESQGLDNDARARERGQAQTDQRRGSDGASRPSTGGSRGGGSSRSGGASRGGGRRR